MSNIDLSSISCAIFVSVNQIVQAAVSATVTAFNTLTYVFSDPQFVTGLATAILLGLVTGGLVAKVFGLDLLQAVRSFVSSLFTGFRDLAERLAA